jgi:hypothetical protein
MKSALTLTVLALALASCGGRQPLRPLEGQKTPAVPVGAESAPTAQQFMTPPMQSRPGRSVDLLSQSEKRQQDPFDLPPESQPQ